MLWVCWSYYRCVSLYHVFLNSYRVQKYANVNYSIVSTLNAFMLFQNGTLKIVDRKKHIFKLAQGEYIAPEKIENVYTRSDPVAQMFVHGDSLQVRMKLMWFGGYQDRICNI